MKVNKTQDKAKFQPVKLTLEIETQDEWDNFVGFVNQYDHLVDEACTHNPHLHFNTLSSMLKQIKSKF